MLFRSLFWGPGHMLVAGPSRGPRYFQDPFCLLTPASFLRRYLMVVDWSHDALKLFPTAFSKGQHRRGCRRCFRNWENLADIPLRWGSTDTTISDAGCIATAHKRYLHRGPIKRCAVFRRNRTLFVATAGKRRGCGRRELSCLEEPGQFILGRRRSCKTARVHNLLKE